MAVNVQNYRVVLVAEQALDMRETLRRLEEIIDLAEYDRRRVMRETSASGFRAHYRTREPVLAGNESD